MLFLAPIPPTPAELPNIVIFYADDLGYGDVGVYNEDSKIPTPYLDQLASEGLTLTDAHSSSGICTPSRYSLLTGNHHWRKFHGIVNSFGPSSFDEELTLPQMLKERGYDTACIGKWHLGWNWDAIRKPGTDPKSVKAEDFDWSKPIPDGPLDHGFDYYFGDDVPNFPPYTWIRNDRVLEAPTTPYVPAPALDEGHHEGRPGPMVENWQLDAVMPKLTEDAVDYIDSRKGDDDPFFLYFPFTSPHAPIAPEDKFKGSSDAGPYGDFVTQTDWTCGQVIEALERNGLADNTLIIFTADNGPEIYAYNRIKNYDHYSMGDLRGIKRDIWEGGHRVPFIVKWPGAISEGSTSDALTSQVDIMTTIAAITAQDIPSGHALDGVNQVPVWQGRKSSARRSIVHNTYKDHYALRLDDWVLYEGGTGDVRKIPDWFQELRGYSESKSPFALFRLDNDFGQAKDLFLTRPVKARMMATILEEMKSGRRPTFGG